VHRAGRAVTWPSVAAETALVAVGAALLVGAIVATQRWLDAHMLPSFFLMRRWYVALETAARVAMAVAGLGCLTIGRRLASRLTAAHPSVLVSVTVAAILGLAAADLVIGWLHPSSEWLLAKVEPLRRPDARVGWTFVPNRVGHGRVGGRDIDYVFDAAGYRTRGVDEPVDVNRATILFTGESVMAGEGLTWEESVPAQVGAMLNVQSANLSVFGFATDQSYLRLQEKLPTFRRPVAVVSIFMPALFGRNLDDDRPHLDPRPGLVWAPAAPHSRLFLLGRLIVPFRRESTVERGIGVTREIFRATASLAAARGAAAVILVPQLNHEDDAERDLRRRVLDEAGLPYVFVEFDDDWRIPGDVHPNARAAHAMAEAVAARLRGQLR
jgi:hypothetical protein